MMMMMIMMMMTNITGHVKASKTLDHRQRL